MVERATPRVLRTLSPHEVGTSQRSADAEGIDPLLTTPADELDQAEGGEPTALMRPGQAASPPHTRRLLDELDHVGLDVELSGDHAAA
jgi:hypothetical protein